MKTNNYFPIFITLLLATLMVGCEQKAELANVLSQDDQAITNRYVDDCEDCPNMDDCCCEISWVSGNSISFELCGSTDGDAAACSDDLAGCTTINGLKNSTEIFSMSSDRKLFCMAQDQSFTIKALTLGATLNVSCKYGQLNPQSVNLVFTGSGTKAVSVDGDCEVAECYP